MSRETAEAINHGRLFSRQQAGEIGALKLLQPEDPLDGFFSSNQERSGNPMRAPSRIAGFFAVLLAVSGAPLERSSAQIVYQYQYAAKVVCGRTDQLNPVVPQTYATSINVNNPNDSLTLFLRKWLVVTFPPGGQRAMQPTKALNDSLLNRFALTSDCRDIRQRFGVTAALFEGFLVVQSTQPLDVVGVYTVPGGIEVVPVTERRVYVGR